MGMVCLLACCCGCSGRPEGAVRLPIVRIDTVGVYGTPRTVQFPGCVRAAQEVNAAFKVGGTLRTIFAEEGEFVRRGAPLAALDARDYRLQAEAAEAEYKRVKAEAERVMALYADEPLRPTPTTRRVTDATDHGQIRKTVGTSWPIPRSVCLSTGMCRNGCSTLRPSSGQECPC